MSNYPQHYACIPCRVSFKGDFDQPPDTERRCPTCSAAATAMGLDFKAPRKAAISQWRKLALLVADGIRFDSCGCNGPGPRPRTLADAKAQQRDRRRNSVMLSPRRW